MVKLHLGCGTKHIPGYINIDCQQYDSVDVVMDIMDIDNMYIENSVDAIYICHVLEHFEIKTAKILLKKMFKILKKDGILRLSVPDFEAISNLYQKTHNLKELLGLLYSNHDIPYDGHYTIWDFDQLSNQLINEIGFAEINRYDWRETEHAEMDDFSQAYLPHMDKENGTLMSLNVEAKK